ncbi:hypothetical protein [Rheinheimera sp.]|uniref:hypothetical protein n=1 Tax=Rheinheimera sp. TaxID=1869214 RepID=UPI0037C5D9FD
MIYAHFRNCTESPIKCRYVHSLWSINQHRISFLVAQDGKVEQVFDKFKTKDHHQVVLDYLN